jgi:hypothetical protein
MLTLIMLNWKRPAQLARIVERQRSYAAIERVIVWNNNPAQPLTLEHADVINCNRDHGLFTRFAAAALAPTDAVLLQDDDILVPEATVQALYETWRREPGVLHGTHGRQIDGQRYVLRDAYGVVDVVLTRCMIAHRDLCLEALRHQPCFADLRGTPSGNGEDIVLSAVAFSRTRRGNRAYRLPFENLPEPHAISRRPNHQEHRNQVVRRCIDIFRR